MKYQLKSLKKIITWSLAIIIYTFIIVLFTVIVTQSEDGDIEMVFKEPDNIKTGKYPRRVVQYRATTSYGFNGNSIRRVLVLNTEISKGIKSGRKFELGRGFAHIREINWEKDKIIIHFNNKNTLIIMDDNYEMH